MDIFYSEKEADRIWHGGESQFDKNIQFYDIVLLLTFTLHEYQVFNSIFIAKCVEKRQPTRMNFRIYFANKSSRNNSKLFYSD